jgi:hypothetical protein
MEEALDSPVAPLQRFSTRAVDGPALLPITISTFLRFQGLSFAYPVAPIIRIGFG